MRAGGLEGRHPRCREFLRNVFVVAWTGGHEVDPVEAVDLHIDEPRYGKPG
jgi:hypothetical protein